MPATRVLHLISQLSTGGASRAALTVAKYSSRQGPYEHALVSLAPPSKAGAALARAAGVALVEAPDPSALQAAIAEADIVHLHFWNTPEIYALLRSDWPPARLLLWVHVGGRTAPQMVTRELASFGDRVVATSPVVAELPALREPGAAPTALVTSVPDFESLAGLEALPHAGYNVGYIGTVDFEKMHPDFIAMHAAIEIPGVRFIVCGAGGAYPLLQRQASALGLQDRFDFHGYLRDLRPVLSILDVFGYPLRPDNYSTAELVLREVMYAGVPPVVFPNGGAGRTVTHNVTGLIAPDAAGYSAAVEWLYHHPAERAQLGRNAREEVLRHFPAEAMADGFSVIYGELLSQPKRGRRWSGLARGGAEHFVESLGDLAADFVASMRVDDEAQCLAAEARIAAASPPLASAAAGGILHYRRYYPCDAYLRLWAGLVLSGQGHPALAVAEFTQAAKLGLDHWRVAWYQAQSAEACGAMELAEGSLKGVLASAPRFIPARELAQRLAAHRFPGVAGAIAE